ncbi:hypothetical protein ASE22_09320 [Sphingomonas sp. Root720]|nr:hypothetical protein ASE22_09320 [Sphingomonas sp. Root720]
MIAAAARDNRNNAISAICCGSSGPPTGSTASSSGDTSGASSVTPIIGVSTRPGQIALTRNPRAAKAGAAERTSPSTACLVAA